ncbi:substrate-binding periplasmic protein [Candidatus Auribacterota bacterium]
MFSKYNKPFLFLFFTLFSLFFLVPSFYADSKVSLILAYEDKVSFPYYLGNGKDVLAAKPGTSVEIIKLLEKKLNVSIRFVRHPWKRCLKAMEHNEVDGTFNASFKEARLKMGRYPFKEGKVDRSRRLLTLSYGFYKLKGSKADWNGKNFTDLQGNIGVVLGYSVEKDLKEKGFPVDTAPNTQASLDKLLRKRVNLIAGSESQIDSYIRNYPRYSEVVKLKKPWKIKASYLMLSHKFVKEHPDLTEKIWDSIAVLRESKEVQAIYDKYYQ